jgi:hypothetical protein
VISIDTNGDVVIVTVVEPEVPSSLADTVADPADIAVATPEELIKRTATFDVVHTGCDSTFFEPSCNVAFAVNCWVAPVNSEGDGGATEIDVIGTCQKSPHDTHNPSSMVEQPANNP